MLKSTSAKIVVLATSLYAMAIFGSTTHSTTRVNEHYSNAPDRVIHQMPATESDMIQAIYMKN
ncbi:hypothetical protein [Neptunicella sp.]|uniref:hypothetical protein n=1 Tax=Neptunicella sp. TaxID=2125986 RepID=UPI003F691C22